MDGLKNYLVAVCAASVLAAFLHTIVPGEKFKRILEFAGGVLLLLVVVSPVVHLEEREIGALFSQYISDSKQLAVNYHTDSREQMDQIITDRCTEYILDKAEMLGMAVSVTVRLDDQAAVSYPIGVTVDGEYTEMQKVQMSKILEQDIGISISEQEWIKN